MRKAHWMGNVSFYDTLANQKRHAVILHGILTTDVKEVTSYQYLKSLSGDLANSQLPNVIE